MSAYLRAPWRSVPSIATAFPELAGRNAPVEYTVIADGAGPNPVLIAARLPEDLADHLVELHNKTL